ncbi:MAG: histidine kinase, partial [Acidobacteriota bacterium]|nr:histidine kinase [Acidobacteriota bacterium]
ALAITAVTFSAPETLFGFGTAPRRAAISVGATLFACASAGLFARGGRLLDRVLFDRPDYATELRSTFDAMARAPDPDTLGAIVSARLERLLSAEFVHYESKADQAASVVVRIGMPDRTRGYLSLGPRTRAQQYRSEDLNFLDAVAAQFAGLLESFAAREQEHLAATAELRALRAQINPHFLFNALNTLADMAKGQPETERAILNLSRIFRYTLDSTQRETVELGEELAANRAYLEIEKERFEDKLIYHIDAPEDLLRSPIPPMLIQPLVENAIKHGLSPKVGSGTVTIAAARADNGLRVTVRDDGLGFNPSRTTWNVGLSNVRARIEKKGGRFQVESEPGLGTKVTFYVL